MSVLVLVLLIKHVILKEMMQKGKGDIGQGMVDEKLQVKAVFLQHFFRKTVGLIVLMLS